MKKILIFYGSYGGGHLSAAKSIRECLENNYTNNEILMVDCIEYINKALNKITTKAYADMAKNAQWVWEIIYNSAENGAISKISNNTQKVLALKLNKLLKQFKPDLIISTHPFSSQMCGFLKKKENLNCKIATILTDYAPHTQWLMYPEQIDYFFVAHDGMKLSLEKTGIPSHKVFATGIPLSNRFLAHYDKTRVLSDFGLQENKKTVLFFAGGEYGFGKDKTFNILKSLINDFPEIQVVAIAGKNEKMKHQFEALVSETNKNDSVKVLEFTNKVPELMSISDLVISKPGRINNYRKFSFWFANYCYKSYSWTRTRKCRIFRKSQCWYMVKKR